MSEVKKKKQLLDENKDMFISEYDKTLSYDALNKIINAKKDFINAAKNNDKTGMTIANAAANTVRAQYGKYTGGLDGSEYNPFDELVDDYEDYESEYENDLDKLYKEIKSYKSKFKYNYEKDPAYQAYKKLYDRQGALAYERALAENSFRTGGLANSHAHSAAVQAQSYYNSRLADIIPELYEAAYDRYYTDKNAEYNKLRDSYDLIAKRESRDYDRYLNKLERDKYNREFDYEFQSDAIDRENDFAKERIDNEFTTARDNRNNASALKKIELDNDYKLQKAEMDNETALQKQKADREYDLSKLEFQKEQSESDMLYQLLRDAIADEKWRSEYNLDASKQSLPPYQGNIGTGDILSYARAVFQNNSLTMEDLYRILGL